MYKKILIPFFVILFKLQIAGASPVAHWRFHEESGLRDISGNGHPLVLRGKDTRLEVLEGNEGGLRIHSVQEPGEFPQGAMVRHHASLSPASAFTLEVRFKPDRGLDALPASARVHLIDKNYVHYRKTERPLDNKDYTLYMVKQEEGGWVFEVKLGFGESSVAVRTPAVTLFEGMPVSLAFTYDGEREAAFYLDGEQVVKRTVSHGGPVVAGGHPLVIGDRIGSQYGRFSGWIQEVKISQGVQTFTPENIVMLTLRPGRRAFTRMESDASLEVMLHNYTPESLTDARIRLQAGEDREVELAIPDIKPGEPQRISIPVDSRLKPGRYPYVMTLADREGSVLSRELRTWVTLVPRAMGERMPVVMWNTGDLRQIKEIGFTHFIAMFNWLGELKEETKDRFRASLDRIHAQQLKAVVMVSPGRDDELREKYGRMDRSGNPYPIHNVNGNFAEVQDVFYREGKYRADTFGDIPSLGSVLVNTEIRDHTQLSFHSLDREAYRRYSGRAIPDGVTNPRGVVYQNIPGFPRDRVIRDNDPVLSFYQWFWREGDAWNRLNTRVVEGLRDSGKIVADRFWTWHDPSIRVPSIYGSGGDVDYLSQWTYTYPDPLKIALACDQLFAMARGREKQQVMKMTQLIWYRNQTTNQEEGPVEGERPAWESEVPDARFISIAPDHLREALWLKLSYPVQGIMYHGWASLVEASSGSSYRLTNRETRTVLKDLIRDVVRPLGPTLMQVPDGEMDVAWLESFASQMFARRGTYGWGRGWGADAYLVARYAGLQPEVIYDETIADNGLGKYKILFVMHADVLTRSVVEEIKKFQRRGGIVIGDEFLAPAVQPDILVSSFRRTGRADQDKQKLLEKAVELSDELQGLYEFSYSRDNPEIILRARSYGTSEYLFVANDHRTYGDYVGQYRLVMEEGIPASTRVELNRKQTVAIYDLMKGERVEARSSTDAFRDGVQFDVDLEAGGGNVYLVLEKPLGAIDLKVTDKVESGSQVEIVATIPHEDGTRLDAILPVELLIQDPSGDEAEFSGYYAAVKGTLQVQLDIAENDLSGEWRVSLTNLANGEVRRVPFVVVQR